MATPDSACVVFHNVSDGSDPPTRSYIIYSYSVDTVYVIRARLYKIPVEEKKKKSILTVRGFAGASLVQDETMLPINR